jgi:hypothetical protein
VILEFCLVLVLNPGQETSIESGLIASMSKPSMIEESSSARSRRTSDEDAESRAVGRV